jgi:hypothetical protein
MNIGKHNNLLCNPVWLKTQKKCSTDISSTSSNDTNLILREIETMQTLSDRFDKQE